MISTKRLLQMARKWQKMASLGRRRISWFKLGDDAGVNMRSTPLVPSKGSFVVYSQDGRRFVVPLEYINTAIFRELFQISEEEFGLPYDGPIVMPFDAVLMEYLLSLLSRRVSKDVEKALLSTVAGTRCSTSSLRPKGFADQQQLLIPAF